MLLPCLCIGCSIYWDILPEQIRVQSGSGFLDPETVLRMKETMEASMQNMGRGGSIDVHTTAEKIVSEVIAEVSGEGRGIADEC